MELKVWCDGIQRVVCGASTTTTCQDIVFALAHATGQTGRFILIEKWRNNERVLAPSDRPLASLAKWGEYANDVMFIMKKSGDVTKEHPMKSASHCKKSDTELVKNRKENLKNFNTGPILDKTKSVTRIVNNGHSSTTIVSIANTAPTMDARHYQTLPANSHFAKQHSFNNLNAHNSTTTTITTTTNRPEPFVRSISFHKPPTNRDGSFQNPNLHPQESSAVTFRQHNSSQMLSSNSARPVSFVMSLPKSHQMPSPQQQQQQHHYPTAVQESIYSTVQKKNRPRQPPPYNEAIAKSSLVNSPQNRNSSPQFHQQQHQHQNGFHTNNSFTRSQIDIQHKDVMNLIDMQQQTLRNQERDIVTIDQELNMMQNHLTESGMIAKRYEEEMEILRKLWIEQEMLIEKLEAEKAEIELEELLNEAQHYDNDLKDVKKRLDGFESEIDTCRNKICDLMKGIEDASSNSSQYLENNDDEHLFALLQQMRQTIADKDQEIAAQDAEMVDLDESIERLEKENAEKEKLIEQLAIEIKDANVESLEFGSNQLYVSNDDDLSTLATTTEAHECNSLDNNNLSSSSPGSGTALSTSTATSTTTSSASANSVQLPTRVSNKQTSGTSRKIPVLPHELGNTVPTKKNPDGIWV